MKRGTPHHPKMYILAETLKLPLPCAVGIMEMLWQFTSDRRPMGNIGSLPDKDIAQAVGWKKSAKALIEALCSAGWVDQDDEHRFIIHDWPDHAETSVCRKLVRDGKDFLAIYGKSAKDRCKLNCPSSVESVRKRENDKPRPAFDAAKAKVEASSETQTTNQENASTRPRGDSGLDFDDPIQVFIKNSSSRSGLRKYIKEPPKDQERLDGQWDTAEDKTGRREIRGGWLVFLEYFAGHVKTIEHPQKYFLASIGRWVESIAVEEVKIITGRDFPAEWNHLVPGSPTEWSAKHSPIEALRGCIEDEVFCSRFSEVCDVASKIHAARGKDANWLTFEWILRRKNGSGFGWWRLLTDLRGMAETTEDDGLSPMMRQVVKEMEAEQKAKGTVQ